MKFAILIPTVPGTETELEECLEAIHKYSEDYDYEVLIDKNDFEGYTVAMNRLVNKFLENKTFTHCILLNDDIIVTDKNWIYNFTNAERLEGLGIIAPGSLHGGDHIRMGFCLINREVIEKVGLFDTIFKMLNWDDVDYSVRAMDAGYKLIKCEGECYRHLGSRSTKFFTKEMRDEMNKNKQRFRDKHQNDKWGARW